MDFPILLPHPQSTRFDAGIVVHFTTHMFARRAKIELLWQVTKSQEQRELATQDY